MVQGVGGSRDSSVGPLPIRGGRFAGLGDDVLALCTFACVVRPADGNKASKKRTGPANVR